MDQLPEAGGAAAIDLDGVSLVVPAYHQAERSARSLFGGLFSAAFEPPQRTQRVLLDGIDLHVRAGDRLAVLGSNGAGKSTLLRVIAGAYTPSSGSVRIQGELHALLNVSLGFNLDATVRENVYLRGAAMGMTIREVHGIVPAVLEFAGLVDRAGDRLRVLSAGQRMRLSFAITTSRHADIMVMDEWIGTGDADFIEKARARLMGRVEGASIVLLASHSVPLLMQVCERAIYLEDGRIVGQGDLLEVVGEFIPQSLPPKVAKRRPPLSEAEIEQMRADYRAAAREAKKQQVRAEMVQAARVAQVQAAREAQIALAREAARAAMVEAARTAQIEAARAAARAAKVAAAREEVVSRAREEVASKAREAQAPAVTPAVAPTPQAPLFAPDEAAPPVADRDAAPAAGDAAPGGRRRPRSKSRPPRGQGGDAP